jgi:hydroxysqualene synthase
MTMSAGVRSGKTHRDENFPVASRLVHPRHRATILAFYEFVRTADDIADHPSLPERDKLALLDQLEDVLLGKTDDSREAARLRLALAERCLSPRHAQDLLTAFRMDVTKRRYWDWDELIQYCSYSAMPVGRFVLDVHGESRMTWPVSDALCAALQIINHLQDCGADYGQLDRVYIPLDALERHGLTVEALGAAKSSPAMRHCLHELAQRTSALLRNAETLSTLVSDLRLGLEISVTHRLARKLTRKLTQRDPLSERVHLNVVGFAGTSLIGIIEGAVRRAARRLAATDHKALDV